MVQVHDGTGSNIWLSVFNVADLNSRCGKRNCACGTLVRDFHMGLLLAIVIPTESLSLSVVTAAGVFLRSARIGKETTTFGDTA